MKVANIFTVHPADALACSCILAPEKEDVNLKVVVDPRSVVEVSV